MEQRKILRINELAKKSKCEGLTAEEKKEQEVLRREYIDALKSNLRASLENIAPGSHSTIAGKVESKDKN